MEATYFLIMAIRGHIADRKTTFTLVFLLSKKITPFR
jgi:hypothetical protein